MKRLIKIFLLLLTLAACRQNTLELKTPENTEDKFAAFIAKKKFAEENHYPGIADEKRRTIFTEKINQAANDFKIVSESEQPTDLKYQEKIRIGLLRFSAVYMDLDTEDRERVCSYFEELMDIVELESSNGLLNKFMYGFDPNEVINVK